MLPKSSKAKEEGEEESESPSAAPPPPSHQMDADEEDENVKQLQECSVLYLALQECLIRTDRDWRSCQREVRALKACHAKRTKAKEK